MSLATYAEGIRAAIAGEDADKCPYSVGSEDAADWLGGHESISKSPGPIPVPKPLPKRPRGFQLDKSAMIPVVFPANYTVPTWMADRDKRYIRKK